MSSNYKPIKKYHSGWVRQNFNCELPSDKWADVVSPTQLAPFIYMDGGIPICELAQFGLIPFLSHQNRSGRRTYNARTETVAEEASYKKVWNQRKFGLAIMEGFFLPVWENGLSRSWCVKRVDLQPIAVPSIWERLMDEVTGEVTLSFSLLTVNADHDLFMNRFHKDLSEKRSIVILKESEYLLWLDANHSEARSLLKLAPNDFLMAEPSLR